MSLRSNHLRAALLFALAGSAVYTWVRPPLPNNDFLPCLRSWDWYRAGGSFQHLPVLAAADLARPAQAMLTWWSPGTYLPTAAAEWVGLTVGQGMTLWLVGATVLGLLGWQRVWRQFGFGHRVVTLSLLVAGLGWHALYSFRIYNGGELTRFALLPWLFVVIGSASPGSWRQAALLFGATVIAGCAKLSLLVTLAGITAFLWWQIPSWRMALRLGAAWILGVVFLQVVWLGHGQNPSSANFDGWRLASVLQEIGMAFVLPANAVFAQTSMAARVCDLFGWAHPENNWAWLGGSTLAAAALYFVAWRHAPSERYRHALVAVGGATIAFLAFLYLRKAAVNFEDRHARDAALLLVPGLVAASGSSPSRVVRLVLGLGLLTATGWGVASLARAWCEPARSVSNRDIALWRLSPEAVAQLEHQFAGGQPRADLLFADNAEAYAVAPGVRGFHPDDIPVGGLHGRGTRIVFMLSPAWHTAPPVDRFLDYQPDEWTKFSEAGYEWWIASSARSSPSQTATPR